MDLGGAYGGPLGVLLIDPVTTRPSFDAEKRHAWFCRAGRMETILDVAAAKVVTSEWDIR